MYDVCMYVHTRLEHFNIGRSVSGCSSRCLGHLLIGHQGGGLPHQTTCKLIDITLLPNDHKFIDGWMRCPPCGMPCESCRIERHTVSD